MNPSVMRTINPNAQAKPQGAAGALAITQAGAAAKLAALKTALKAGASNQPQAEAFGGEVNAALAGPGETRPAARKAKADGNAAMRASKAAPQPNGEVGDGTQATTIAPKSGERIAGRKIAGITNAGTTTPEPVTGNEHPGVTRAQFVPHANGPVVSPERAAKWKETVSDPQALQALMASGNLSPRDQRIRELHAEGKNSDEIRIILKAEGLRRTGVEPGMEATPKHGDADITQPTPRTPRPAAEPRADKGAARAMNDARSHGDMVADSRPQTGASAARATEAASQLIDGARARAHEVAAAAQSAAALPVGAPGATDTSASSPVAPQGAPQGILAAAGNPAAADAPINMAPLRDAPQAAVLAELSARIAARMEAGRRVFDIRLDPPEMGSINVRLSFNADGQMNAALSADRAEAVELLRRDAPELMRMMREAGVDLAGNGLSFSLDGGRNGAANGREMHALLREQGFGPVQRTLAEEIETATTPTHRLRALDISI